MPDLPTKGWLPADIDLDRQPALVSDAAVRWMDFGTSVLAEPFFAQTIENLRGGTPPAHEIDTGLDIVLRMADKFPAVRPAGFIFHVSHCGSTLVANGLKTAKQTVVASEPLTIIKLARRFADVPGRYLSERWQQRRRTVLDACFRLFAHYRTGEPEALIIKFTSINTMCMPTLRSWWPDTPCVLLVREPSDVLVAALGEPGWMKWKEEDPELARELFDLPVVSDGMSGEEYCARILGRLFEAALPALDAGCKVIDYEDLSPKRVQEIATFFGIELARGEEDLNQVFSISAKDPKKTIAFRSDRLQKRSLATSAVLEAARRWARPSYSQLRASGDW